MRELSTTLLFTFEADSLVNHVENHKEAELHSKDRKLTWTSEMYIWSSRHPTNMILNFM